MESTLLRPAVALLPSAPAGRIGFGRLSLAALPGHDVVVHGGRRVGTGYGGVRLAILPGMAPARDVRAAFAPPRNYPEPVVDDDKDDEFKKIYSEFTQKVDKLHADGKLLSGLPLPAPAVSDKEKAVQDKIKEIAEGCIDLHADAMRRLPLKQRRRMYPIFWAALLAFATVASAAKEGRCSWGLAWAIADSLDALRRMVSRACDAPLRLPCLMRVPVVDAARHLPPNDWGVWIKVVDAARPECEFTALDSCEEAMLTLLQRLWVTAKDDVDAMISVAPGS